MIFGHKRRPAALTHALQRLDGRHGLRQQGPSRGQAFRRPAFARRKPSWPRAKATISGQKLECSESRQEALLDEGLEESFPGSDPVSVKRIT